MKRLAALLAVLALAGCSPSVKTLTVEGKDRTLGARGATLTLEARGKDGDGKPVDMAKQKVAWSSSDPEVAAVDATGLVTAKRSGVATVKAAVGTVTAEAPIAVVIPDSITVTPESRELAPGATADFTATVLDDARRPVERPAVVWSSNEPGVATVMDGRVVAAGAGTAVITAAVGTLKATAQVKVRVPEFARLSVTPAKTQLKVRDALVLRAAALDKKGAKVGGVPVTWRSSNAQIASVGPDGKVQAVKKGTVTITASAGKKSASSTITVTDAPAKSKSSTTSKSKSKPKK
jgi:trimeric autotransporter adhesin